nr:alpha/beta hydrolase [bacterium]
MMQSSTLAYKRVQGLDILADIYPSGQARAPVIIFIHGGALIWDHRGVVPKSHIERLHGAGWAVVTIDYRLAPESKLPDILQDIRDAIVWVRGPGAARFGYDGQKLCVMGNSAGGYLALMCGCLEGSIRPNAIVSLYGYGDILGDWYAKPSEHYLHCRAPISWQEAAASIGSRPISVGGEGRSTFYYYTRQQGSWLGHVAGEGLWQQEQAMRAFCPAYAADGGFPPTLLLHGTCDTDVPYTQSVQMKGVLEGLGRPVELIGLEGLGHSFDEEHPDDPAVCAAIGRMMDFLNRHK